MVGGSSNSETAASCLRRDVKMMMKMIANGNIVFNRVLPFLGGSSHPFRLWFNLLVLHMLLLSQLNPLSASCLPLIPTPLTNLSSAAFSRQSRAIQCTSQFIFLLLTHLSVHLSSSIRAAHALSTHPTPFVLPRVHIPTTQATQVSLQPSS